MLQRPVESTQFTSEEFTGALKARGVAISMDGKGAWRDNIFVERLWRSIKYEEVVCYERDRSQVERKRCFTKDEGRPLEVGLQEQASNRLKLRRSRAVVVSVDGKGGAGLRQVRIEKTNASKPLMTCRNVLLSSLKYRRQTELGRMNERALDCAESRAAPCRCEHQASRQLARVAWLCRCV